MEKTRGFEYINGFEEKVKLPERSTQNSAGYDFFAIEDKTIPGLFSIAFKFLHGLFFDRDDKKERELFKPVLVPTGIKAYMQPDEMLCLYNRSSNPLRKYLLLGNSVGIIDSDYYGNADNGGHIFFQFWNLSPFDIKIKTGSKIGQGVFQKFLKADNDCAKEIRKGGHGFTD